MLAAASAKITEMIKSQDFGLVKNAGFVQVLSVDDARHFEL